MINYAVFSRHFIVELLIPCGMIVLSSREKESRVALTWVFPDPTSKD